MCLPHRFPVSVFMCVGVSNRSGINMSVIRGITNVSRKASAATQTNVEGHVDRLTIRCVLLLSLTAVTGFNFIQYIVVLDILTQGNNSLPRHSE